MKLNKYLTYLLLLILLITLVPSISFANTPVAPSIGEVLPPPGTQEHISAVPTGQISILFFISRIIRIVMIIGGVWAAVMILLAGYTFITSSGDSGSFQKVRSQLTNSIIGLFVIIITYTITAVISLILFGDAGFILNPEISTIL